MTVQIPDELINECPDVNLAGLYLYAVITGDIQSNYGWGMDYPFRHKPRPPKSGGSSANWRGYVASFRLTSEGRLVLVSYNYPASAKKTREEVNEPLIGDNWITIPEEPFGPGTEEVEEQLVGDFWIVMTEEFFGRRIYIPFRDGVIVKDRDQWNKEEKKPWHN
jgi:hypothetical protein